MRAADDLGGGGDDGGAVAAAGLAGGALDRAADADRGDDGAVGTDDGGAHRRHAGPRSPTLSTHAAPCRRRRAPSRPSRRSSGSTAPTGHDRAQLVGRVERRDAAPAVAVAHVELHALAGRRRAAARARAGPPRPAGSRRRPPGPGRPGERRGRSGRRRRGAPGRAPRGRRPGGGRWPGAGRSRSTSSAERPGPASASGASTTTALSSTPTSLTLCSTSRNF